MTEKTGVIGGLDLLEKAENTQVKNRDIVGDLFSFRVYGYTRS